MTAPDRPEPSRPTRAEAPGPDAGSLVPERRAGGLTPAHDRADPVAWTCPLPHIGHDLVTLAHGGGGLLSSELVADVILPAYGSAADDARPTDAALLAVPDTTPGGSLAFTTDTYVVRPRWFPGGDLGMLAVHGTVNDLAMMGARPLALSTAFVIEEGFEVAELAAICASIGAAAAGAGVRLVTGDTKVVERGAADGCYVNTSGVGVVDRGVSIDPSRVMPGDSLIVSGPIGRHGTAVMSRRSGLEFDTEVTSDTAALHRAAAGLLTAGVDVRAMRDLTRGGLTAGLCEVADQAGVGLEIDESAVPVPRGVTSACGFLGLDPWQVANEGTMLIIVAPGVEDRALDALSRHPETAHPALIGSATSAHSGQVVARTRLGARRIIERTVGDQLPRIC